MFVTVESKGAEETVVSVNEPLAKSYIDALRHLQQLGGSGIIKGNFYATDLARLPDVLTVTKAEEDLDSLSADLCAVLEEALSALGELTGQSVREDVTNRIFSKFCVGK